MDPHIPPYEIFSDTRLLMVSWPTTLMRKSKKKSVVGILRDRDDTRTTYDDRQVDIREISRQKEQHFPERPLLRPNQ